MELVPSKFPVVHVKSLDFAVRTLPHCSVAFQVEDSKMSLHINEVGPDFCDLTYSEIDRGQVNPAFVKRDRGEVWLGTVWGRRARLSYDPDDLASTVIVDTEDIYANPEFFNFFDAEDSVLNATGLAVGSCGVMASSCPRVAVANEFQGVSDCIAQMESLPLMTVNEPGLRVVDGNSTICRSLHGSLAALNPEAHCEHISFKPLEDSDGKVKCSISDDLDQKDFFSDKDFRQFQSVAELNDLDPDKQLIAWDETTKPECAALFLDETALTAARLLPDGFACQTLLERQKATGEDNAIYWGALAIIWFVFFFVEKVLLYFKATTA